MIFRSQTRLTVVCATSSKRRPIKLIDLLMIVCPEKHVPTSFS